MLKRAFDIAVAAVALLVFAPLFVLISFLIVVTDGLPILFVQERVGCGGSLFRIFKFRTMTVAKETNEFEPGQQSRVTRVGRLLRKTKLDELPQLWNVLLGDMSLVGPRPEVAKWVQEYPDRWAKVHTVRPGITDPASIAYRNEEELLAGADDPTEMYRTEVLPRKLDLYEQYVSSQSFVGDVRILFRTLVAIVL